MTRFVTLFYRYIVRDLAKNPARTLLTLTGVALGIAVVVGVQLANDRAIGSFNDSLRIMSGRADLQIAANGLDLDESLIGELAWVWDVGAMTAIIEGRADLDTSPNPIERESLRLFGIDLLSDAPFRSYVMAEGGNLGMDITREQFIDLLVEPDRIIVPSVLADRFGLDVGSTFRMLIANRWCDFRVGAILRDEGIARAFDGKIVFMDIAAAQLALNKLGGIDRIEILLDDPSMADAVAERIAVQLPESVIVYRPEDTAAETEKMTRAFRYNLKALSYIALVVGMILIYNTLNIAVVRRRGEIAALRTLGTSRRTIRWMFLIEATAFGVVGAVLGVWVGSFLARAAGALVSRTISMLYTDTAVSGTAGGPDPILYVEMILLGGVLAAVSGTGPALRATRVAPAGVLRADVGSPIRIRLLTGLGLGTMALATAFGFAPPVDGFPFLGYLSGVLFILAFGLLSPVFARALVRIVRRPLASILPAEGRLAIQTIEGSLPRIVVAVISLSIAVAMLISVAIMVASFRDTVIVWVDRTLQGDLYLRPAAFGSNGGRNVLEGETLDVLEDILAIAAIDRFRGMGIDYDGFPAILGAGEFETLAEYSSLMFMGGRNTADVARRLIEDGSVAVSEPFSVRHGVGESDTIMLPTPTGMEPFAVEAVFYDYSSEGGFIVMDRSTYLATFDDPDVSNVAVYLEEGADVDAVRAEILGRLPDTELRIATNGELRSQVLGVFDQTFQVTYALEVIALAVAVLGIANTLAALIIERRPELAMLRFIGAARGQIRRVIVLESGLIGVLGGAIGLVLGILLSVLLIYVINFQSFGWTIQFRMPWGFLAQSLAFVLVATVAAGLYPASLALKMDPIKGIRAE